MLELLNAFHSSGLYHRSISLGCMVSSGRPVINDEMFRASRKGLFLHSLFIVPSRSTQLLNLPPIPKISGVVVHSMDMRVVDSARRVKMKMVTVVAALILFLGASNGLVSPSLAMPYIGVACVPDQVGGLSWSACSLALFALVSSSSSMA